MTAPSLAAFRATDHAFAAWHLENATLTDSGTLTLDPSSDAAEATGPTHSTEDPFSELIPSWNAVTPPGTWIETLARVYVTLSDSQPDRWTPWYSLGIWTAHNGPITRHSISRQEDADARVATDTIVLRRGLTATAYQLKLRLHRSPGIAEPPSIHALFVALSHHPAPPPTISSPSQTNTLIPLPQCSQMVYADGGEVWCSPTCVSMVLARWLDDQAGEGARAKGDEARRRSDPRCEPRVRAAVAGVYDHVFRGHGNWPFNTAYAFHAAYESAVDLAAYVTRLPDLAATEPFVSAGVPLILSYGWRAGELSGAPIPISNGHLVVLAGFDSRGDPIIHDPAAPTNATVRRTYRRHEIERLWLAHSAGTACAIHPPAAVSA